VQLALVAMFAGTVVLLAGIDEGASAEIVAVPLLLLGLGIGGLASQLGSVTVSAVLDELAPEVGGVQNTATNIGASLGTALAGSVLWCVFDTASPGTRPTTRGPTWDQDSRPKRGSPVRLRLRLAGRLVRRLVAPGGPF
jgi:hypothetical protein